MHPTRSCLFVIPVLAAFALPAALGAAADKKDPAPATKPAAPAARQVGVEEFDKARQAKDAVVIDVRSPDEFAAGHIPGAVNVPVAGKGSENFDKKVAAVAKDKTVLVHCRSGVRSSKAVEKMRQMGVAGIIELPTGWVAWSEAGKPVEQGAGSGKSGK